MSSSRHVIRDAVPDDVPQILRLIQALADYENEPDAVVTTEADLHAALFSDGHVAYCHIATLDDDVVGFALWFLNFSTWRGKPGIYLEDLFVDPSARRHGIGRDLLQGLIDLAKARGYDRVDWMVLDWNKSAQAFYRSLGAVPLEEWTTWRVCPDR